MILYFSATGNSQYVAKQLAEVSERLIFIPDAIEMQDKRPVWVKEKCTMCLGCLHRCPKFAIQYGKNTKQHGQYQHK